MEIKLKTALIILFSMVFVAGLALLIAYGVMIHSTTPTFNVLAIADCSLAGSIMLPTGIVSLLVVATGK